MDNFHIKVVSEGREDFNDAIKLATKRTPGGKATHYQIAVVDGRPRLTLYWTKSDGDASVLALPYPMDPRQVAEFAWGWLRQADYGHEPDHDGSNSRGFDVFNQDWGHVGGVWQTFVAVEPAWAMYGK